MLTSVAYVLLLGLGLGALARLVRLPPLVGMLAAGIVLGPCVLNLLSPQLLDSSADLRQLALIIILTRAGLSLELDDLRRAGRPAVLLCFVPASFEVLGMVLLAPRLLGVSLLGAALGLGVGFGLSRFFAALHMRDSVKVVLLLALAFLLVALEDVVPVPCSGLLAVLGMGLGLRRWRLPAAERLTAKFGKLWVWAEVMLFVLVGAEVDLRYAAAIGGVPLAMGLACGRTVLTVAVVAILVTAPLGALAIDASYRRLLKKAGPPCQDEENVL